MEKARRNLDLLFRQGVLTRREVRRDERTLDFLEAHPHRRLPRTAVDWGVEGLRFVLPWDPGPYFVLRAVILGGGELKTWRSTFRSTMILSVVHWTLMMGSFAGFMFFSRQFGESTGEGFRGWANACPVVFCGGLIFAGFLYGILGRDLQSLAGAVERLTGPDPEPSANIESPESPL